MATRQKHFQGVNIRGGIVVVVVVFSKQIGRGIARPTHTYTQMDEITKRLLQKQISNGPQDEVIRRVRKSEEKRR